MLLLAVEPFEAPRPETVTRVVTASGGVSAGSVAVAAIVVLVPLASPVVRRVWVFHLHLLKYLLIWLAERNRARDIRCVAVVPHPAIHNDKIARFERAVAV